MLHDVIVDKPSLGAAELVVVAALGEAKARAVCEALEHAESSSPLAIVTRRARAALFLLDPAAASLLSRK
jgi:6-phosphogluconolactonase/glucosamine-6-phosphate isomerase/deaminase